MNLLDLIIIFLLTLIVYFLYHIAKQLSYLTGRRITFKLFNKQLYTHLSRKKTTPEKKKEEPEEKLVN